MTGPERDVDDADDLGGATVPIGRPEPDQEPEQEPSPGPDPWPAPAQETVQEPAAAQQPDPAAGPSAGRRRVRIGTVVLGLVLAAVAVTVWVGRVLERHVSVGAVATGVMIAAGALLLGGAVLRPDPRTR